MLKIILSILMICTIWTGTANAVTVVEGKPSGVPIETLWQDPISPILIVPANQVHNTTVLGIAAAKEDKTITVVDNTGFTAGDLIILTSVIGDRYSIFYQVGALAGNVVTLDSPMDYPYEVGSQVTNGSDAMNVNGGTTPQIFSLRAADSTIGLKVHVTRIIMECITTAPINLTTFGDIAGGIVNGLVMRVKNGDTHNIWNVKTNGEIGGMMFDFDPYLATNPAQGVDGFIARMTFSGPAKMGTTIEVGPNEDVEFIVQDNLSSLLKLKIIFEGHIVTYE